jgi:hypothetical protein
MSIHGLLFQANVACSQYDINMKDINKILANLKAHFQCIFFKWCEETHFCGNMSMKLLEVSLSCLHLSLPLKCHHVLNLTSWLFTFEKATNNSRCVKIIKKNIVQSNNKFGTGSVYLFIFRFRIWFSPGISSVLI